MTFTHIANHLSVNYLLGPGMNSEVDRLLSYFVDEHNLPFVNTHHEIEVNEHVILTKLIFRELQRGASNNILQV